MQNYMADSRVSGSLSLKTVRMELGIKITDFTRKTSVSFKEASLNDLNYVNLISRLHLFYFQMFQFPSKLLLANEVTAVLPVLFIYLDIYISFHLFYFLAE